MIRLGMLTPSSNTVLEPVTAEMIHGMADLSMHVSRFPVTEIALDQAALQQFDDAPILSAATLLTHAKVDVIAWNGTSASWLGLDHDRRLVERIEAETGTPATTCVLGLFDLFRRFGVRRIGLVTPYTADVQARIVERYRAEGVDCTFERHLDIRDNYAFGTVPEETIATMVREAAASRPDAIVILCTNLRGARVAAAIEAETGVLVFDSIAVTLWAALVRIGAHHGGVRGFGQIFDMGAAI
jgi:maleate isomerase